MDDFLLNPGDKGTIPQVDVDAKKDAAQLYNAAKGDGADEQEFINILTNRNTKQRLEIVEAYRAKYKSELKDCVKGDFSGHMEDLLLALVSEPSFNDAADLNTAVKGAGTDEDTLVEIICTRSVKERQKIMATYEDVYKKSLIDDIADDTSRELKDLLITALKATIDPSEKENDHTVVMDAERLVKDNIHPAYVAIFARRSLPHMRKVNEEYKRRTFVSVGDAFMNQVKYISVTKEYIKAFGDIMLIINDKALYLASRILHAVKGAGTKNSQIIRVFVSRGDKDLQQIKHSYDLHMGGLKYAIRGDTSGSFRDCLFSLGKL